MKEILGSQNEYGVVTEMDEDALYQAVRRFFAEPDYLADYQRKAAEHGNDFERETATAAAEKMLLLL